MPGLYTPQPERSQHDMPMTECYERLWNFLETHSTVNRFTVDDDNHDMGLLCAHLPNDQVRAATVRLNRRQISNFMANNGFRCEPKPDSTAVECIRQ